MEHGEAVLCLRKTLDALDKIIMLVLVAVLTVMVAVGAMQVFSRYVLQSSLSWSEELMRYLYVWATMLGLGVAIRRKSFACVDSLLDFVGKKSEGGKRAMQVVSFLFQVGVFLLLIVYGGSYTLRGLTQHSPAMLLKMAYIYAAFPVGGFLGLVYTLEEGYDNFISKTKHSAGAEPG